MIYTVEIDDSGKTGKSVVQLLKDLSKSTRSIRMIETVKDDELLDSMKASLKSGRASRKAIDKTLKAVLGE
jgi:hypothetical protein